MAKEFPRPKLGDNPTEGKPDELLDDVPDRGEPGSMEAYAKGSKVRRWVFGLLIVGTIGAGIAGHQYFEYVREESKKVRPEYVVDEDAAAAAVREFVWSEGEIRLALSREAPGVNRIVLPDRDIVLAEGYDHAQIKVTVRGGKTVKLKVLAGKIEMIEKERPEPPPTAAAKGP